jgi:8-oxo-dGTP pyrophosphatase MutT (NUDIX family)
MKTKIKALLDKAASTEYEAEASIFIAKAEKLMEEHQISAHELGDDSDPIGMTKGVNGQTGPTAYKTHLQRALSRYYGCENIRIWHAGNKKWHLELVGALSARVTTELMTDFVWKQCNAAARELAQETGLKPGPLQRRIVNSLCSRIYQIIADRADDVPKTEVAAKNSLVVKNATLALYEELYPNATKSRAASRSTTAATRKAAAGISLHRQTSGAKVKQLR